LIAIDPTEANRRAVRAYANAGFRIVSTFVNTEGPGVLMLFPGVAISGDVVNSENILNASAPTS
jgi:hypothetical protein